MIDTIKLVLDNTMFWIKDINLFQKEKQNACRGYFTLVQNGTKGELKQGIYKPKLTMTKRFNCSGRFEPTLTIEFSIPKLLFLNNLEEVTPSDFETIIAKLQKTLSNMGIRVFTHILKIAPVSSIHYSKNILLKDGSIPHSYIEKLRQSNISSILDINQSDYQNGGENYKLHAKSYEIVFYDKKKELLNSDLNYFRINGQLKTAQHLFLDHKFEVLRMEVRLNLRQKIKQIFRIIGQKEDLSFENLFNEKMSQKILLHYIDFFENKRLSLFDYNMTSSASLLSDIIVSNSKIAMKESIVYYGLKRLFTDLMPRELRNILGKYSQRSWYRLIQQAKAIKLPIRDNPFDTIRQQIIEFKLFKISDYYDNMLNVK